MKATDDKPSGLYWYNALESIMGQLPDDKKWKKERRARWLKALETTLDVYIEIEDAPKPKRKAAP